MACTIRGVDCVDTLNLDSVFPDDAVPGRHGVECAGAASGVFYEQERDGLAVGRPGWLLYLSYEVGELLDLTRSFGPEEDLVLIGLGFVAGAVGTEGESVSAGRPDWVIDGAVGCAVDLDDLVVRGIGDLG